MRRRRTPATAYAPAPEDPWWAGWDLNDGDADMDADPRPMLAAWAARTGKVGTATLHSLRPERRNMRVHVARRLGLMGAHLPDAAAEATARTLLALPDDAIRLHVRAGATRGNRRMGVLCQGTVWVWPTGCFAMTAGVAADAVQGSVLVYTVLYGYDPVVLERVVTAVRRVSTDRAPTGIGSCALATISAGQGGPRLRRAGRLRSLWERDNYEPDVQRGFDTALACLTERTPTGRVILLDGPPGTGKTWLIRGLLCEAASRNARMGTATIAVVVPAGIAEHLGEPGFLDTIIDGVDEPDGRIVLIIEDADSLLTARERWNVDAIAVALGLGDGLLSDAAGDIRILLSTNAALDHVDPALLRPGRLAVRIHVPRLPEATARRVLGRLYGGTPPQAARVALREAHAVATLESEGGGTPDRRVSLAEVYAICRAHPAVKDVPVGPDDEK